MVTSKPSDAASCSNADPPVPGECGHAHWGPERWLELARHCQYLPENDMHALCSIVARHMQDEPNIVEVSSPVTVCGDIHGQYYDLEELLAKSGGEPPDLKYVFLGDYVDRGFYSLETLTRLLTLKAAYPQHVVLIRGNHETRQITQVYGFYDECQRKYGNAAVWRTCCHIFDLMPIAALIDDSVLCVHGGLSPQIKLLDQIYTIERECEIPQRGAFCDLMWSDPEEAVDSWAVSPRGAGWLFGQDVADKFRHDNRLELIARAHQLVMEGYKYLWDDTVVTVWSAPNYCYRCGNVAAVLHVRGADASHCEPVVFEAVPDESRQKPDRNPAPYFL